MELPKDSKITRAKYNAFLGTIALCIIYAAIALILLLLGLFTTFGKTVLFGSFNTFTQTYIFSTIVLIIVITVYVNDWNGKVTEPGPDTSKLNPMSCPDYWQMKKLSEDEVTKYKASFNVPTLLENGGAETEFKKDYYDKYISDDSLRNLCIMDTNIFEPKNHKIEIKDKSSIDDLLRDQSQVSNNNLRQGMILMAGDYSNNNKVITKDPNSTTPKFSTELKCNSVFPDVLAKMDYNNYASNNFQGSKNLYRCAYSKQCNIPWTDAGCSNTT